MARIVTKSQKDCIIKDGIRSKQVGMSSSGEIMATSYVRAEQRTVIPFF